MKLNVLHNIVLLACCINQHCGSDLDVCDSKIIVLSATVHKLITQAQRDSTVFLTDNSVTCTK